MNRTNPRSFDARALAFASLLLFAVAAPVGAQTTPPTPAPAPKSAEVVRLEEEKAQAELRKAITEANKAALEAQFPKPATTPLAGTTTVDGAVIENHIVSYKCLADAADQLVGQLKNRKPGIQTLVVYNERDVNLLLSYKVALNQLELMKMGYDQLIEPRPLPCPKPEPDSVRFRIESLEPRATSALVGPVPLLTLATSIFGSFADLTALLRTNVEVKGQSFDIEEAALVSEVFRAAKTKYSLGASLFYPAVFPPNLDFKVDEIKSNFLTRLDSLNHLKAYVEGLADALDSTQKGIKKVESSIENLKANAEGLTTRKREAEARLSDLEKIYGSSASDRHRRIPPEKLEAMLELRRTIADLQKQLDAILAKPDGKLARAEAERDRLKA